MLLPYTNNNFKQKKVTAMPLMIYIFMVIEMTDLILILDFTLTKHVTQWKQLLQSNTYCGICWLVFCFVLVCFGLGFLCCITRLHNCAWKPFQIICLLRLNNLFRIILTFLMWLGNVFFPQNLNSLLFQLSIFFLGETSSLCWICKECGSA